MTVESELESPPQDSLPGSSVSLSPSPSFLLLLPPCCSFYFHVSHPSFPIFTFNLLLFSSRLLSLYHLSPHTAAPQSLISARWAAECYACRKRGHVEFMLVSACCSRRCHIWAMGLGWNTSDCMMNAEWEGEKILPTTPAAPNPSPLSSQPSSCRCYCGVRAPFRRFLHPDQSDGVRVVFLSFRRNFKCSFQQHIMYHQSRDYKGFFFSSSLPFFFS